MFTEYPLQQTSNQKSFVSIWELRVALTSLKQEHEVDDPLPDERIECLLVCKSDKGQTRKGASNYLAEPYI